MFTQSKNRTLILPGVALLLSVIFATPLRAAEQPNSDLFKLIQEQVIRYSLFTVFDDVSVQIAENGHVVLTGHVLGAHKTGDIWQRVKSVEGVTNVTNNIQLIVSYISMEAVNVSGLAQGQVKALNQQRSAGNIFLKVT